MRSHRPTVLEEDHAGYAGRGCSALAILLAIITAIPFLGWGNWIATIPVALVAIIFSLIGLARSRQTALSMLALVAGVVTLFWATFRLTLGAGIF